MWWGRRLAVIIDVKLCAYTRTFAIVWTAGSWEINYMTTLWKVSGNILLITFKLTLFVTYINGYKFCKQISQSFILSLYIEALSILAQKIRSTCLESSCTIFLQQSTFCCRVNLHFCCLEAYTYVIFFSAHASCTINITSACSVVLKLHRQSANMPNLLQFRDLVGSLACDQIKTLEMEIDLLFTHSTLDRRRSVSSSSILPEKLLGINDDRVLTRPRPDLSGVDLVEGNQPLWRIS